MEGRTIDVTTSVPGPSAYSPKYIGKEAGDSPKYTMRKKTQF
jgi:hypothetical protein